MAVGYCSGCGLLVDVTRPISRYGLTLKRQRLTCNGRETYLTPHEAEVMRLLLQLREVSKDLLAREFSETINAGANLKVYITRLRAKLKALSADVAISSKWGFGYALEQS